MTISALTEMISNRLYILDYMEEMPLINLIEENDRQIDAREFLSYLHITGILKRLSYEGSHGQRRIYFHGTMRFDLTGMQ